MQKQEKLFVVVDPTNDEHIALERAIITAQLREPKARLSVFVGVDNEAVDTRSSNDNLFRDLSWFEEHIHQPIKTAGLEYDIELSWCAEWRMAIIQSSKLAGADTVLLPVHRRTNRRRFTFSESKWDLLKSSSCPVVLVRPGARDQRKVVMAAVNFQATKERQRALNARILEQGRITAENYGAEFHVVNAYLDSMHYPDRGKLAKDTGLDAESIHVKRGYTDEVVSAMARELQADLVVMGTLGQTGKTRTRRGNTAERVIAGLDVDVMVFN